MRRIIRYLLSRMFDYGNMSVSIHIYNERNWVKFVNKYKPKITLVGEGKKSRYCFYTGEVYIAGCLVTAYSTKFKNAEFDVELAKEKDKDASLSSSLLCAYYNDAVTVDEDKMIHRGKCDIATPSEVLEYYSKIHGE